MQTEAQLARDNPTTGIFFIVVGMLCISVNDMLIKQLSGDYPLHQIIFFRSLVGISASLVIVQFEGGFSILKTKTPGLHALRGLLIVIANMAFFTALAVLPLADATALFFVAPLFITLLSMLILGENVGPRRITAVLIGFGGVLIMLRPGGMHLNGDQSRLVLLLPVVAALCYALMQILTRKLGVKTQASAMAVYIQGTFIVVSLGFWFIAGDGRFAASFENESAQFLLRGWHWPADGDRPLFLGLGVVSAIIGYALSQAYRSADAATIAPFEYVALPLAIMWGWVVWGDLPDIYVAAGIVLIVGSGLYVFIRERRRKSPLRHRRAIRRW
ncbi:MAG: DMT family transporter [Paracoccaceae bacterium]